MREALCLPGEIFLPIAARSAAVSHGRPRGLENEDVAMIIIDLLALWIAASLGYACLMIIKPLPAREPHNDLFAY